MVFPPLSMNRSRMEKGSSLNSAFLTPKPPASSLYVPVLEAPPPRKRSISVMSPFNSLPRPRIPGIEPGMAIGLYFPSSLHPEHLPPVRRNLVGVQAVSLHVDRAAIEAIFPPTILREGHVHVLVVGGEVLDHNKPLELAVVGRPPAVVDHDLLVDVDAVALVVEVRHPLVVPPGVEVAGPQRRRGLAQGDQLLVQLEQPSSGVIIQVLPV